VRGKRGPEKVGERHYSTNGVCQKESDLQRGKSAWYGKVDWKSVLPTGNGVRRGCLVRNKSKKKETFPKLGGKFRETGYDGGKKSQPGLAPRREKKGGETGAKRGGGGEHEIKPWGGDPYLKWKTERSSTSSEGGREPLGAET